MKKGFKMLTLSIAAAAIMAPSIGFASWYSSYWTTTPTAPTQPSTQTPTQPATQTPTQPSTSTNWWTNYGRTPSTTTPTTPSTTTPTAPSAVDYTAQEQYMVSLVNQERAKAGLPALQVDATLTRLARMKAKELVDKQYFSHTSPTYGTPDKMMRDAGLRFTAWGENISQSRDVYRSHVDFMSSSGHRANILSPNFTKIGIGIVAYGNYGVSVAQEFIRPY